MTPPCSPSREQPKDTAQIDLLSSPCKHSHISFAFPVRSPWQWHSTSCQSYHKDQVQAHKPSRGKGKNTWQGKSNKHFPTRFPQMIFSCHYE